MTTLHEVPQLGIGRGGHSHGHLQPKLCVRPSVCVSVCVLRWLWGGVGFSAELLIMLLGARLISQGGSIVQFFWPRTGVGRRGGGAEGWRGGWGGANGPERPSHTHNTQQDCRGEALGSLRVSAVDRKTKEREGAGGCVCVCVSMAGGNYRRGWEH